MNKASETAVAAPTQVEQQSSASQGFPARFKSWDRRTVVLTVFGLLLTSMAAVGGMLVNNALNELRDAIQSLEETLETGFDSLEETMESGFDSLEGTIESGFKSLDEKAAAKGERLAHIEGRLGVSGDSSAHRPSGTASSSNQWVGSKLLSVHFEALR